MRFLTLFLSSIILACSGGQNSQEKAEPADGDQTAVRFAKGFTIMSNQDGFTITVRNPQDTTEILGTYVLGSKDSSSISVPINRAILNSTTFGAFFDHLEALDEIKGMTYTQRVLNDRISKRIESGQIQEVISGDGIDFERVLQINPDAVFAYSFGETDFSRYEELGIPIVLLMDYKESHPLGRAEWIKVVGCFLGKYEKAKAIYDEIEDRYQQVQFNAMLHSYRPSAFTGSRYGDFWYAPGRDSYIAQFIRDAGAQYTFDHIKGQESAELDFEKALIEISDAEFWGLIASSEEPFTKADILEMNPLYEKLTAFQKNQIFVCNTQKSDYFGDAIMEPHLILSDLYRIFHPQPDQDSTFHYFNPIR
jgi:iron complex transport system substrate-binding protein